MASPLHTAWTLDPEITFLNHGSFGACPRAVLEHQAELRARIEREPVLFLAREIGQRIDTAREELARFLNASPEDVVPVRNATSGVNAVVRSLELSTGDELVVTRHGYNACNNTVAFAAERAGAQVVWADVPFPIGSPDELVEVVLGAVTERTRFVLIDHVTSPTGLVLPVERLVSALRERGIATMVDGAHAPGMLPLDLTALDPDYYTGNCHKWICAPKGAAFLYVRRELQPSVRPTVISHSMNSPRTDRSRFRLEFDWGGTDDPTAFLSVPVALRTMADLVPGGWAEIRRRNHDLVVLGRRALCGALGIEAPAPEEMLGSLASVPLPPAEGPVTQEIFAIEPMQKVLFEEHRIEVPVFLWPDAPERLLRISAQLYNSPDEYERLAAAVGNQLTGG